MALFTLTVVHGASWDASRGIREQRGWDAHAAFMDALVDDGFVVLGGPIGDGEQVQLVVEAVDERSIEARLAEDPWAVSAQLRIGAIQPWTIWLHGRQDGRSPVASVRPQPLLVVADVQRAGRWYRLLLGAESGHGGDEYERLLVDGELVLQLHRLDVAHHHGTLADPSQPLGNGVAVWFQADDFDAAVRRSREADVEVVTDVHVNPNAGHRELWLRDPDGYLVVLAES